MFADIALAIAGLTGSITLLDLLLGKTHKKQLEDAVLRAWNWLADARKRSLINALRTRDQVITVISALLSTGISVVLSWRFYEMQRDSIAPFSTLTIFVGIPVGFVFATWLGFKIAKFCLAPRAAGHALLRASATLILMCMPLALMIAVFAENGVNASASVISFLYQPANLWMLNLVTLYSLFSHEMASFSIIFWLTLSIPVVLIYLATLILIILEITLRRIAEHSSGPLIAATAILGAFGAIAKTFAQ